MKLTTEALSEIIASGVKRGNPAFTPEPSRFLREIESRIHPPERKDRVLLPFMNEQPFPVMEGQPFVALAVRYRSIPLVDGNLYQRP